jgi:hypothetical protein
MKKSKQSVFVSIAFSAIIIVVSVAFQAQPAKISGTWNMVVETSAGSGTPVFVLKQVNDTLISGTYSGQLGEAPVRGTIKANKISLKLTASDTDIEYVGIVDGSNMKGKVIFGTIGEGTFTGQKK